MTISQVAENQPFLFQAVFVPRPGAGKGAETLPSVSSVRYCTDRFTGLLNLLSPQAYGHCGADPRVPVEDTEVPRVSAGQFCRLTHEQE